MTEFDNILQSDIDEIIKSIRKKSDLSDNYKNALINWLNCNIKPKYKLIDISHHFFHSDKMINGLKRPKK